MWGMESTPQLGLMPSFTFQVQIPQISREQKSSQGLLWNPPENWGRCQGHRPGEAPAPSCTGKASPRAVEPPL